MAGSWQVHAVSLFQFKVPCRASGYRLLPIEQTTGSTMSELSAGDGVLDVRHLRPHERHAVVLASFDALATGQAIEVVSDHQPMALYHQFASIRRDLFRWESVESGPRVWRVRIQRREGAYA